MRTLRFRLALLWLLVPGCATVVPTSDPVRITLLHMNDVYEILPVRGGQQGGLARVATIRKQLLHENPNTLTMLAGDLFSPSALGTAEVDGKPLNGRQMVATMNDLGLDYATFGNHEFDLPQDQFLSRLRESKTQWISSNVLAADGRPFPGVASHTIIKVGGATGTPVRIGLFGLTIDSNRKNWVRYEDPIQAARREVSSLRSEVDILIAMTHLSVAQDQDLVETLPEIDLVLGGHEHEDYLLWRGPDFTPILKADANARTVYIVTLQYDRMRHTLTIVPRLQPVTSAVSEDPDLARTVQSWQAQAFAGFRAAGFNPEREITTIPIALDGTETSVRNQATKLTDLIAQGMLRAVPNAELAIFNGGSIRLDDVIVPGPITEYDVIRTLPFGDRVLAVDIKGRLLQQVLEQGQKNKGGGGYLQTANVDCPAADGRCLVNHEVLTAERSYRMAINNFLLTGRESGLSYLTPANPDLKIDKDVETVDIRQALINALKNLKPK